MPLNDSPNAINYFHKVLDTAPQADLNLRSRTYSQLGYIFDRQWLDADALAMFKQAYRYDSLANDTVSMIFTLRDIGGMHTDMNQPDSASICYERALRLAMESRDKQMTVSVMGQLARFYNQQNSYNSAMAYLRRISSLECDQDRSSIVGITASWYEANGKLDSAIIYYKELAETGTIYTKADAYGKLAEHYLANNDLAKAKECLATYKQLTDSIQAITATETINQKHDLYEYRFREREIHRLQLKNKEKAIIISILTSICTITLLTLAFAVKYKRQKRDTQKIKLEKYQLEKGMLQGNTEETASKEELMRNEEICKSINIMLNDPHSKKENHRGRLGKAGAGRKQDIPRLRPKAVRTVQDERVRLPRMPAHQDKNNAIRHCHHGKPEHPGGEHAPLKALQARLREERPPRRLG